MMRNQLDAMKRIVEVRRMQRMAAEMASTRAETKVREADEHRRLCEHQLGEDQEAWVRSLTTGPFDPQVAGFWSSRILSSQDSLGEADETVASAKTAKAERATEWRIAEAREDAADLVARTLFKRFRRAREEAALSESADRAAYRSAAS